MSGRRFTNRQSTMAAPSKRRLKREKAERLSYYISEFIFFISLCASAILEPSLISSIYFLYFLFIGSWFALDRQFGTGYHYFRLFIAIFVALHFSLLYFYQFSMFYPLIPSTDINARLFGLVGYINNTCSDVRHFQLNDYHFVRFLHPLVLLILYFVSVQLIRTILIDKKLSQVSVVYIFFLFFSFLFLFQKKKKKCFLSLCVCVVCVCATFFLFINTLCFINLVYHNFYIYDIKTKIDDND